MPKANALKFSFVLKFFDHVLQSKNQKLHLLLATCELVQQIETILLKSPKKLNLSSCFSEMFETLKEMSQNIYIIILIPIILKSLTT